MSVRMSSPEDYTKLIDKYDTWMFDCDGVLWHGDRLIEGALGVLKLLRDHSKYLVLLGLIGSDAGFEREKYTFRYEQRD